MRDFSKSEYFQERLDAKFCITRIDLCICTHTNDDAKRKEFKAASGPPLTTPHILSSCYAPLLLPLSGWSELHATHSWLIKKLGDLSVGFISIAAI